MIRYISTRLLQHGRLLWRQNNRRLIHTKLGENSRKRRANAARSEQVIRYQEPFQRYGFSRFVVHARKLLLDNVGLKTAGNPSADLRTQMVKKLFYSDSGPMVAFVGIAAAAEGATLLQDAELEETCWKIRETVEKFRPSWDEAEISVGDAPIGLDDLHIGAPIAKGCSAVVHAAALKRHTPTGGVSSRSYPLALKIMFNYDVQSNAMAIVRAMFRETVPARYRALEVAGFWQHLAAQATLLPPHPNVVSMLGVFCAQMPSLEGAHTLYPSALPPRLHESGFGRNMSLFLLMRRYHCSLRDFLDTQRGCSSKTAAPRWALLLFAQLLEAVAHLNRYGVAHRDLKSDNILIDVGTDGTPGLVVADFGCCMADKEYGLRVPYPTVEMDKGGNTALMAPEIITQNPGTFATLDYTKADLWTSGAIAYEIFGAENPFYSSAAGVKSYSYRDGDLPLLGDDVPLIVRKLIGNLLQRNPKKRLSADVAANAMQLFLWAPTTWLRPTAAAPTHPELLQWLLCLTSKVLYENAMDSRGQRGAQFTEYFLISSFLVRASLRRIEKALLWIRRTVAEEHLDEAADIKV